MEENHISNDISEPYNIFYSKTDWKENSVYTKIYLKSLMRIIRLFKSKQELNNILDIGCGTGIYTKFLSHLGYNVLGIDYSSVAIEKAKIKFPDCCFEWQDASILNLQEKFDVFFAKGLSLFNTKDLQYGQDIINSWNNHLADRGIIVIQSRTDFSQKSPSNWYFHTEDEIREMFMHPNYNFDVFFIYNKLQYLFLLPFSGKKLLMFVSWISKRIVIKLLKKPVNYVVFLKKK